MPFDNVSFDMVINRHGDFIPSDIYRLMKPSGIFITQQVDAENDRELVELLCSETEMPLPRQYLDICKLCEDDLVRLETVTTRPKQTNE